MKTVVLGGYGNAGIRISRLLPGITEGEIVLAGRNLEKAETAAASVSAETGRIFTGAGVDASDPESLARILEQGDLVIAATSGFDAESIIRAAVKAGTHYLDIYLSNSSKMETLRASEEEIIRNGLCFITDGGFHPGVPGAMVRMAGVLLPALTKAEVGGCFSLDWSRIELSQSTRTEFLASLCEMDITAFVQGEWIESFRNLRKFDFGPPQGKASCFPMFMEEFRNLPVQFPSLRDTGFYIAGFHPVIDYLVMPACMAAARIFPGRMDSISNFFAWALRKFSRGKEWGILLLDAAETINGKGTALQLRMAAPDPYDLTALPVISCLRQFFQGRKIPGVHTQAEYVDPLPFFMEMEKLGVELQLKIDGEPLKLG